MTGFNFRLDGLRATVLAELPKQKLQPANCDQSFMPPLASYIAAEIGKLEPKFNGVICLASGEVNKDSGRIIANIQIFGKKL